MVNSFDEMPDEGSRTQSKTRIKQAMLALQQLGRTLAELPDAQLVALPLNEKTLEAVRHLRGLSKGALKRQTQYTAGLLNQEDVDAVRKQLAQLQQPDVQAVREFHQLEQWRDRLLEGDNELLEELVHQRSGDRQQLRQLVRNAQRERESQKPPKSARLLFKLLRELQQP